MRAPIGWLGLIAGKWTVDGDASSSAQRAVRAGRALGLRTLAVSTDERCLARLAADGWSLRPASGMDPASIATAFAPAGSRTIAPALLLGDGAGLSDTTARVAALLGAQLPEPGAAAGRRISAAHTGDRTGSRFVVQAQDGDVVGMVEDVTAGGTGRDYDCPGSARGWTAHKLRAHTRAALAEAGLTRGTVEVILRADGRRITVARMTPGRIDACIASVVELATGHDVIIGAVRSAIAAEPRPPRGRSARRPRRHASLRRADLRSAAAYADAAWAGVPGLVFVRPGPDGVVVTVADRRAGAVTAAESAVGLLPAPVAAPEVTPDGTR
jgi:hypothetical protein